MIQFVVVYNFKKKKDGTTLVQIRAYLEGKRKYFSTGIYLKPSQWNKKSHQVQNHPQSLQYNAEIRRQLDELEAYVLDWIKKHGSMHLAAKIPLHILKAILQHSKIETTMVYLHLSSKMVNDALDGVDW